MTQRARSLLSDLGTIAKIAGVVLTLSTVMAGCLWYGISWAQDRQSKTEAAVVYETKEHAEKERGRLETRLEKIGDAVEATSDNVLILGERFKIRGSMRNPQETNDE